MANSVFIGPIIWFVNISIYDINGRMVEEIINANMFSGYHQIIWDATDQSSGLYFIKLVSGEY